MADSHGDASRPTAAHILAADFLTSAADLAGCPPPDRPELAFAGRSNVGKSSLINALCQRKKLVRVSNTPGRTRTLNFFDVRVEQGGPVHPLRLCDLPGYGYAKVSKVERKTWQELIEGYLRGRARLGAVVLLVDAEVGPTGQDGQLAAWLAAAGRPLLLVATKLDRLNKAARFGALRKAEQALGLPAHGLLGVSSTERLGLDLLWERLLALAGPAPAHPPPLTSPREPE